jgi:hypothetical protein
MRLPFTLGMPAAISLAFATSAGCAVGAAPTTDPPPADPPATVPPLSGRPIVDGTPVSANVGTILSQVTTTDGRTFQFGRAPSDAVWVAERGHFGTPPSLRRLAQLHPSVVDIFREVSGAAEIPEELARSIRPAPAVRAPPPPMVRSDVVLGVPDPTLEQSLFELYVCSQPQIAGNQGYNGICLLGTMTTALYGENLNLAKAPGTVHPFFYITEYGTYYGASMTDPSCAIAGVGLMMYNFRWDGSEWILDYWSNSEPGEWVDIWINDPGLTYRATSLAMAGVPPWGCPGAVAMGD